MPVLYFFIKDISLKSFSILVNVTAGVDISFFILKSSFLKLIFFSVFINSLLLSIFFFRVIIFNWELLVEKDDIFKDFVILLKRFIFLLV